MRRNATAKPGSEDCGGCTGQELHSALLGFPGHSVAGRGGLGRGSPGGAARPQGGLTVRLSYLQEHLGMKSWGQFVINLLTIAALLSCAGAAKGQSGQDNRQSTTNRRDWDPATGSPARRPGVSELESENLRRVAAPASLLRTVLAKDPGLMVELKRLVAREATNNGQVVEDADLTDQGILDRLDRDVEFRSLATRLVQRYGYLQPTANPDSQMGKEEDLLLKERTRRQVQIESQEDNQPPRNAKEATAAEKLSRCEDSENPRDCGTERAPGAGRTVSPPPSDELSLPSGNVPDQLPLAPQLPRDNQLIQTAGGQSSDSDLTQGLLARRANTSLYPGPTSTDGGSGEMSVLMSGNAQRGGGMSSLSSTSLLLSPSDLFNPTSLDFSAANRLASDTTS